MKNFVLICISIFGSFCLAAPTEYRFFNHGKYENLKVQEYEGFHFSENCFKSKTPKCQAYDATHAKIKASDSPIPLGGDPAARFCLDNQALNRIVLDKADKQYDYCLFKDGSMIDAWDLYNHFNPKKVIK